MAGQAPQALQFGRKRGEHGIDDGVRGPGDHRHLREERLPPGNLEAPAVDARLGETRPHWSREGDGLPVPRDPDGLLVDEVARLVPDDDPSVQDALELDRVHRELLREHATSRPEDAVLAHLGAMGVGAGLELPGLHLVMGQEVLRGQGDGLPVNPVRHGGIDVDDLHVGWVGLERDLESVAALRDPEIRRGASPR
jgi:hypothetical protein